MYKRMLLLMTLMSTLTHTLPAQLPINPMSSSPLQAEPVQEFVALISSIRNATAQSCAAKSDALRLFNELYADSTNAQRELLGVFVNQLRQLLSKIAILPGTKERRIILLLEETKHLLNQMLEQDGSPESITAKKQLVSDLMHQLYRAINPTMGDPIRYTVYSVAGLTLATVSIYFIYRFGQVIGLFSEIQKGKGTLGKLTKEVNYQLEASRKDPGEVSALQEIGLLLRDLRSEPKEATTIAQKLFGEIALMLEDGRENPSDISITQEVARALKQLSTTVDFNDPESVEAMTVLQHLVAGIGQILTDDQVTIAAYNKKQQEWFAEEENKGKTHADLPAELRMPDGLAKRYARILESAMIKPDDAATLLQATLAGVGPLCAELALDLQKDRDADDDTASGFTRLIGILEYLQSQGLINEGILQQALQIAAWKYKPTETS